MNGELACDECLRRAWLIGRLASHIERHRSRLDAILGLPDEDLIDAIGGDEADRLRRDHGKFDARAARARAQEAATDLLCRCHHGYPRRLLALPAPPAVLHIGGDLERFLRMVAGEPVAVVGARRASPYGTDVARSLARALSSCGITVISGLALGIDSAAHAGAVEIGGPTVAVLAAAVDRVYPRANRTLWRRIVDSGAAVSEMPPGCRSAWRWMFPARNRLIAGLAAMTIVVEAQLRSGALITARYARELDRPLGAVPGRITSTMAAGPLQLLAEGAAVVRGAQDVLDELYGAGTLFAPGEDREPLEPELRGVLEAISDGDDTAAALARAGVPPERGLAALAELELAGYVRRRPGGRYAVLP